MSYIFLLLPLLTVEPKIEEHIIKSDILGYSLKYWVYVPSGYEDVQLPVLYVTDGLWYRESGELLKISRKMVEKGKVAPHLIVLVDAYDPYQPSRNRRNSQFLCNPRYVRFYKEELIPSVETTYMTKNEAKDRGILGLSFGGLNAMYFAIEASDSFGKVGIQSPAPHPCPEIYGKFEKEDRLPIDIFLSTGTMNDKARATRRLKSILEKKGYDFKYMEVPEGHNWKNWKPLLDDVLFYFYGQ